MQYLLRLAQLLAKEGPTAVKQMAMLFKTSETPQAVLAYIRANPKQAALQIASVLATADAAWSWLTTDETLVKQVEEAKVALRPKITPVSAQAVSDLQEYTDELELLSGAVSTMGNLERFIQLREALKLPDEYILMYQNVRRIRLGQR